jgi:hypothetical protein
MTGPTGGEPRPVAVADRRHPVLLPGGRRRLSRRESAVAMPRSTVTRQRLDRKTSPTTSRLSGVSRASSCTRMTTAASTLASSNLSRSATPWPASTGTGEETAPRSRHALSPKCERPIYGPRPACLGRGPGVRRRAIESRLASAPVERQQCRRRYRVRCIRVANLVRAVMVGCAAIRSTTQRTRPGPEPCSVRRRAIRGLTPRRHSSRQYLSWS